MATCQTMLLAFTSFAQAYVVYHMIWGFKLLSFPMMEPLRVKVQGRLRRKKCTKDCLFFGNQYNQKVIRENNLVKNLVLNVGCGDLFVIMYIHICVGVCNRKCIRENVISSCLTRTFLSKNGISKGTSFPLI